MTGQPPWLRTSPEGVIVSIRLQPGASRNEICGTHGDQLKIRVSAPALEDRANAELLRLLRKTLKLRADQVRLVGGQRNRSKEVELSGITMDEAIGALVTQ